METLREKIVRLVRATPYNVAHDPTIAAFQPLLEAWETSHWQWQLVPSHEVSWSEMKSLIIEITGQSVTRLIPLSVCRESPRETWTADDEDGLCLWSKLLNSLAQSSEDEQVFHSQVTHFGNHLGSEVANFMPAGAISGTRCEADASSVLYVMLQCLYGACLLGRLDMIQLLGKALHIILTQAIPFKQQSDNPGAYYVFVGAVAEFRRISHTQPNAAFSRGCGVVVFIGVCSLAFPSFDKLLISFYFCSIFL